MEPWGIAFNFRDFEFRGLELQNRENNPMHSRRAIDGQGEFRALVPLSAVVAWLDRAAQYSETARRNREAAAYWMPRFRGA